MVQTEKLNKHSIEKVTFVSLHGKIVILVGRHAKGGIFVGLD
jgi:hypothetical protein